MPKIKNVIWICNTTKCFDRIPTDICFTKDKEYLQQNKGVECLDFIDDDGYPHVITNKWLQYFDLKK